MTHIMLALPGEKYYAIPREILEQHAVSADRFNAELREKWEEGDTVFHSDVEGQSFGGGQWLTDLRDSVLGGDLPGAQSNGGRSVPMGVRG